MRITADDAITINRRFGGHLRTDSSLRFAEFHSKNTKSAYKKASLWARAIIADHPFSDANKRTALFVIANIIKIKNDFKMARTIIGLAKSNISDINKIIEILKNSNRGKNDK